ncbi:MAG: pyruvate synthase subunit beta [Candidatus Diapherotrites archaeon]|nr:pyruvate synthase subunit beta [Candidatus Diapherotrites archaeon]
MGYKYIAPGHRSCAGCGEILGLRQIMDVMGKNTVICHATGCMEVTSTPYPQTSWKVPWIHVLFENAAAVASGVAEALKKQGKDDVQVVAIGGDGAMFDIGFQAISGALERGHNMWVIVTDNEAYMNTGIQRSSGTPMFAATTTSPAGKVISGKQQWKKNLIDIAVAHGIPYAATASIAFPQDLKMKIEKGKAIKGPKVLQIHVPCPIGWGFDSSQTVQVAKMAVDSGLWALFEVEDGKYKMTYKPAELKPVSDYLKAQKRFKHMSEEQVAEFQRISREQYESLLKKSG